MVRLGASFCHTLKLPPSRSAPGAYKSPLFLQRILCSSRNQNISPPSGCRKCLWPNSGGLLPYHARDWLIFKIFMAWVILALSGSTQADCSHMILQPLIFHFLPLWLTNRLLIQGKHHILENIPRFCPQIWSQILGSQHHLGEHFSRRPFQK